MDRAATVSLSPSLPVLAGRIGEEPGIDAAFLMGSAATGRMRTGSDVDIALLPARGDTLPATRLADLAADLEVLAGRPVDLGILHSANLVYAKEAIAHGRLLFERDRNTTARFAMHTLSMYAALQEDRKEVLNAYTA